MLRSRYLSELPGATQADAPSDVRVARRKPRQRFSRAMSSSARGISASLGVSWRPPRGGLRATDLDALAQQWPPISVTTDDDVASSVDALMGARGGVRDDRATMVARRLLHQDSASTVGQRASSASTTSPRSRGSGSPSMRPELKNLDSSFSIDSNATGQASGQRMSSLNASRPASARILRPPALSTLAAKSAAADATTAPAAATQPATSGEKLAELNALLTLVLETPVGSPSLFSDDPAALPRLTQPFTGSKVPAAIAAPAQLVQSSSCAASVAAVAPRASAVPLPAAVPPATVAAAAAVTAEPAPPRQASAPIPGAVPVLALTAAAAKSVETVPAPKTAAVPILALAAAEKSAKPPAQPATAQLVKAQPGMASAPAAKPVQSMRAQPAKAFESAATTEPKPAAQVSPMPPAKGTPRTSLPYSPTAAATPATPESEPTRPPDSIIAAARR
ncbi:hypothetical protein T492DRAFT_864499 [Pavlovales sp. CCMP2436]|nr:hypothetical protein T492DRAFT_864499 [Pavlovales sp. CCMP2436]